MLTLREERMSEAMLKTHIEGLRVPAVFHTFTDIDRGDPHDHPFSFRSVIISGGYIEEVFHPSGWSELVRHEPGDSFVIEPDHIHRIVELLDGLCETLIFPLGPKEREPGFYRITDAGLEHRFWYAN